MEFETIKSDRLYVKVADQLTNLVREGKIKPGQKFPAERDLAEKLGVSRPTIREAMIAMELSGIIEIRSGSGTYATDQQPKLKLELKDQGVGPFEILEARLLFEPEACALAATRITIKKLDELKSTLNEMEEEELREDACEKADWKFHSIIAEACQNAVIAKTVNWLWELRNRSELSVAFFERIRAEGVHPAIEDHRSILEALEKRDPIAARKAMRNHLENSTESAAAHFNR